MIFEKRPIPLIAPFLKAESIEEAINIPDNAPVRNNYDFSDGNDDLYDDGYPDHLSQDVDDLISIDGQIEDIEESSPEKDYFYYDREE